MKRCCNNIFLLPVLLGLGLLCCSCGYRIGARSMMHPQIRSISIADVKNNTLEPLASGIMRTQLGMAVQKDGALILKNPGEADCVMYSSITKVETATLRQDSADYDITYRPSEFRLTITLEFSVVIPGRKDPLVAKRTVTGFADYQVYTDPGVSRANALKNACARAADMAIEYTVEGW